MSSDLYPQIEPSAFTRIKLVAQMVEDDPTWLDKPECPYSEGMKEFFRGRKGTKTTTVAEIEGDLDLASETLELYRTLKSFGNELNGSDPKEFMAWIKLAASVQEKLLSMEERAMNVKRQKAFEAAVFAALEVLEPHERTAFRDKLEAVVA